MSEPTVKVRMVNTPAEDIFALKENGYLKSLKVNLKESIKVGDGAAVALSMAYLPITVDILNPEQRLYTIYAYPSNVFQVLPDGGDTAYNYTATIPPASYNLVDLMAAVEYSLNFRADGQFLTDADSTVFGMDWTVALAGTENKTTIKFDRWDQTDPDDTYVTAGEGSIFPADAGLVFDSTSDRDLIRDSTAGAGVNYTYIDRNQMLKDNWEINAVVNPTDPNPNPGGIIGEFMIGCTLEAVTGDFEAPDGPPISDYFLYGLGVSALGTYQYCINGVTTAVERDVYDAVARAGDVIRVQKSGDTVYFRIDVGDTVITAATQADPGVFTSVDHLLNGGEVITIQGATGMTEINGNWTVTVIDADTFSLDHPITGDPLDTTAFGAYNAGTATFTFDNFEYNVTIPTNYYPILSDGSSVIAVFGDSNTTLTDFSYYVRNNLRITDLAPTSISWINPADGVPNGILKYILGFNNDLPESDANTFTWTGDVDIRNYGDTGTATIYLTINGGKIEGYDGASGRRAPIIAQVQAVVGQPLAYYEQIEDFTDLGITRPTEINSFEIQFISANGGIIAYQGSAEAVLRLRKGNFSK